MPAGRPITDSGIILETIQYIADGLSIRKACAKSGLSVYTFTDQIIKPEYSQQYEIAMERRADAIFDEIVDISDGEQLEDGEKPDTQRDRLRIDARKWVVSKMLPKKYGDKQEI